MQGITPCLWFNFQAEEAVNFYLSIFPNSRILKTARYGEAGPGPIGSVMTILFELNGQPYLALNGGPQFKFTEALSLIVNCETQDEVDTFWEKLTEGGEEAECGWLKDQYGLFWQITPTVLPELLTGCSPEKAQNVMRAMFQMKKLDIQTLKQAAEA